MKLEQARDQDEHHRVRGDSGRAAREAEPRAYGRNGVPIKRQLGPKGDGYRSYEVYQRERVGESTEQLSALDLLSPDFVRDPNPLLSILRENYPCYRDWVANSYWITRYDDVTSIFADDRNFETRSRRWLRRAPCSATRRISEAGPQRTVPLRAP